MPGPAFSADVLDEPSQILVDGNRINQESHGKIYRDSQGRVRTESERPPRPLITVYDSVQLIIIRLDPLSKTASIEHTRFPPLGSLPPIPAPSQRDRPRRRRPIPPGVEDLGTKQIEGITANGVRVTTTIPAEAVGSETPRVSVVETWLSPELGEVLLEVRDDTRWGHSAHRLVNIVIGQPDPALFQIPPDYTVYDNKPVPPQVNNRAPEHETSREAAAEGFFPLITPAPQWQIAGCKPQMKKPPASGWLFP